MIQTIRIVELSVYVINFSAINLKRRTERGKKDM